MKKYIALLRGINVGGNNKIVMSELKSAFVDGGFYDVSTYINSGNVIFSSNMDVNRLEAECEKIISNRFNLKITVAVISAKELEEAITRAPEWWDSNSESKHNAIFVIRTLSVQEIITQVGEAKPEYEKIGFYGNVIFWSAPIKTFSKTRWSNIASSKAYHSITIRNSNTAKELMRRTCKL